MRQRIALKIGKRTDHKYHTSKQFVLIILERLSNLINDTARLIGVCFEDWTCNIKNNIS